MANELYKKALKEIEANRGVWCDEPVEPVELNSDCVMEEIEMLVKSLMDGTETDASMLFELIEEYGDERADETIKRTNRNVAQNSK